MRKLLVPALLGVLAASAAVGTAQTSADGDLTVSSDHARVYENTLTFVKLQCAKTNSGVGCPGGDVRFVDRGSVITVSGPYPALRNGASTWARVRLKPSYLRSRGSRTSAQVTARAVPAESKGDAGLQTRIKLLLR